MPHSKSKLSGPNKKWGPKIFWIKQKSLVQNEIVFQNISWAQKKVFIVAVVRKSPKVTEYRQKIILPSSAKPRFDLSLLVELALSSPNPATHL